jgi:hypothetical protein
MLQFLNPVLLFSLVGLAVPIAIHMWSRKAGKRVKIGSIALLQPAPSKQMRSIRLHELALLLLRCLLLTLLVLLIAQPQWVSNQPNKQPGWILISPEVMLQLKQDKSVLQLIDTLQQNGYEVRLFQSGFNPLTVDQFSEQSTQPAHTSYWSLLKEAEEQLPAGTSIYAITDESLQHFQGKRPVTALNVQWISLPAPDTTSLWLADTFIDQTDSLHIQIGLSKPEGNTYQTITQKAPPAAITLPEPALKITPKNGTYTITFSATNQTIQADTTSLQISILYDENTSEDARYVSSAIKAIAGYTRRKINLKQVKQVQQIPTQTQWLFWLSAQQVPAIWQEKVNEGVYMLKYASTEEYTNAKSWLQLPENTAKRINLNRISKAAPEGNVVWENGFGNPILTQQTVGKGNIFHCYSRLNPQWNGLVWDESFAGTVLQLLYDTSWKPETPAEMKYDKRMIALQQLRPLQIQPYTTLEESRRVTNLHIPLWLLIALIFILERWISGRRRSLMDTPHKNQTQQVIS